MRAQGDTTRAVDEQVDFITDFDLHLLKEGRHMRLFDKLGAHLAVENGIQGTHFAVWAPNAQRVYLKGDFNQWQDGADPLSQSGSSGIWSGFIPYVTAGTAYQYHIVSWHQGYTVDKADPFSLRQEGPPRNGSFVWDLSYQWHDQDWIARQSERNSLAAPISVYEVHLASWMRVPEEGNRWLTFAEIAPKLADYVRNLGFTHVQLLPVMENPPAGPREHEISWFFAPAARFGTPQELMFLVDTLHQHDIGVILDWVPAHFAVDEAGLAYFDGTHLYERGAWPIRLPGGGSAMTFDVSRPEVRSFLLSNACYWLDKYHVDGLKADGISPMLHLDFGRTPDQWVPNAHGGRENLEGIDFLRHLTTDVERSSPYALEIAQEETDWPLVTRPSHNGGLGFTLKWDLQSVQQLIAYLAMDPLFRKQHHGMVTNFTATAFSENLVMPLAHQLASAGSTLPRMHGDQWQKFANFRLLLAFLYLRPGKKLVFMGNEFGQWSDWNRNGSLDWHICAEPPHDGIHRLTGDLNRTYRQEPALHQSDCVSTGFEWVESQDSERSVVAWLRRDTDRREVLLVVFNFTPVVRRNYRLGVRRTGHWREILNTDAKIYWGSGQGNLGGADTVPFGSHIFPYSLTLTLPPLAALVLKHQG